MKKISIGLIIIVGIFMFNNTTAKAYVSVHTTPHVHVAPHVHVTPRTSVRSSSSKSISGSKSTKTKTNAKTNKTNKQNKVNNNIKKTTREYSYNPFSRNFILWYWLFGNHNTHKKCNKKDKKCNND